MIRKNPQKTFVQKVTAPPRSLAHTFIHLHAPAHQEEGADGGPAGVQGGVLLPLEGVPDMEGPLGGARGQAPLNPLIIAHWSGLGPFLTTGCSTCPSLYPAGTPHWRDV